MNPTRLQENLLRTDVTDVGVAVRLPKGGYGSLDEEGLNHVHAELTKLADEAVRCPLIVDLSGIDYAGARFLGLLVSAWSRLRTRHRRLAICGLTPGFARLVRTLHLDKLFSIYPTLEAAVAQLSQRAG